MAQRRDYSTSARLDNRTESDKKRVARLLESKVPKAEISRLARVGRHFVQQVAKEMQKAVKLK